MRDQVYHWVARMLPKRLVYWSAIRLVVFATCGKYEYTFTPLPELSAMDALKRFEAHL